mmetsp:Transcript_96384/g.221018  ORF Transcript_96384/g.221018 Transcript_96384/m.221018 type:complete len:94 (+) Transcript_96384:77-358(+)
MMAERKSQEYEAPDFYHFPPFFTIQPNLATREKQLKLWKQFILGWHNHNKSYTLIPNEWEFFFKPIHTKIFVFRGAEPHYRSLNTIRKCRVGR